MPRAAPAPLDLSPAAARRLWLRAQGLDAPAPFGEGPAATRAAVERLGYVQIDTINVIERAHHHILATRIPRYRRSDLHRALAVDKSVFEYWTHALAYVPTRDLRFFMPEMRRRRDAPDPWLAAVTPADLRRIVARIRRDGPLSIRDIDDDELVDKDHPWASRKPSRRVLQRAFLAGRLTVSDRAGMLKTYDLADRHFGWPPRPRPATETQVNDYLLDRALRSQGVVSLDSICHLAAARKPAIAALIEARVRRRRLVPVAIEGADRHWMAPESADALPDATPGETHLLSPFDPLAIQRKRLLRFFGYEHRFEAYVPKEKRVFGYFALPVLVGDRIVAAIDLKADRDRRHLLIQRWTWTGDGPAAGDKARVDEALHRFEAFQFSAPDPVTPSPPSPAP
jgi:uncharacterized protein YcaQ